MKKLNLSLLRLKFKRLEMLLLTFNFKNFLLIQEFINLKGKLSFYYCQVYLKKIRLKDEEKGY